MEVLRPGVSKANDLVMDWPAPKRPKKLPQAVELYKAPPLQLPTELANVSGDPPLTTTLSIAQDSSSTPELSVELNRIFAVPPVNPDKLTLNF